MSAAASAALNGSVASGPSVFKETPLNEESISNNLRDELRRMKRRRQLASQNIAAQMGNTASNSIASINAVDNLPRSPRSAPSSPEPMFQEAGNMSPKSASSSHVPRASVSTSRELENSSNQMSQHETSVGLHADSSSQCFRKQEICHLNQPPPHMSQELLFQPQENWKTLPIKCLSMRLQLVYMQTLASNAILRMCLQLAIAILKR